MEEVKTAKELSQFASFKDYEAAFDAEVQRVELGFVRIGYMLRLAEDTDILRDSGYSGMKEFAYEKYKIDASQASRFININKRFSEGGYSDRLQEKFEGYGVAKLGELLALPDEIIDTLPPELPRADIQEVKREIKEEQKITDLEVWMEDPEGEGSNLKKWLDVYFRENPDEFLRIRKIYLQTDKAEGVMDLLAPSGIAARTARIKGQGKFILSIKSKDQPIELLNVRTYEKETYSFEDCFQALKEICPYTADSKKIYEARYQIPFPEKEKIAPVQPQPKPTPKPKPKPTIKPDSKPTPDPKPAPEKAEPAEEPEEKEEIAPVQPEEPKNTEPAPESEEPSQMEIEDYPECLPEGYIKCHDGSEVKKSGWEEAKELISILYQAFIEKQDVDLESAEKQTERLLAIIQEQKEEVR